MRQSSFPERQPSACLQLWGHCSQLCVQIRNLIIMVALQHTISHIVDQSDNQHGKLKNT